MSDSNITYIITIRGFEEHLYLHIICYTSEFDE